MDVEIKKLIARIEKLENVVFNNKAVKHGKASVKLKTTGPTGGVKHLISKGFFNSKQNLEQAKAALEKEGFHYSVQAVNMAVTRLAKISGPLVALRENGRKYYVVRK